MSADERNLELEIKLIPNLESLPSFAQLDFVIHILKKNPSVRTEKDLQILKEYFKTVPFFANLIETLGSDSLTETCLLLEYRFFLDGQAIFSFGSKAQTAFVLLEGKVQTVLPPPKLISYFDPEPEESPVESTSGKIYGETVLMDEYVHPKGFSVICRQNSHFAVLTRSDYNKIVCYSHTKAVDDQVNFLLTVPLFAQWPSHLLRPWTGYFDSRKTLPKKGIVYKQDEPTTHVYIIKSGTVLCNKIVTLEKEKQEGPKVGVNDQNQVILLDKEMQKKNVEIAVLKHGQFIGEEEGLEVYLKYKAQEEKEKELMMWKKGQKPVFSMKDRKNREVALPNVPRETNMIVYSLEAEIWSIPVVKFFSSLEQHYKDDFSEIETWIKENKKRRQNRINNIQNRFNGHVEFSSIQPNQPAPKEDPASPTKSKSLNKSLPLDAESKSSKPPQIPSSKVNIVRGINIPRSGPEVSNIDPLEQSFTKKPKARPAPPNKETLVLKSLYDQKTRRQRENAELHNVMSPSRRLREKEKEIEKRHSKFQRHMTLRPEEIPNITPTEEDLEEAALSFNFLRSTPADNSISGGRTIQRLSIIPSRNSYLEEKTTPNDTIKLKPGEGKFARFLAENSLLPSVTVTRPEKIQLRPVTMNITPYSHSPKPRANSVSKAEVLREHLLPPSATKRKSSRTTPLTFAQLMSKRNSIKRTEEASNRNASSDSVSNRISEKTDVYNPPPSTNAGFPSNNTNMNRQASSELFLITKDAKTQGYVTENLMLWQDDKILKEKRENEAELFKQFCDDSTYYVGRIFPQFRGKFKRHRGERSIDKKVSNLEQNTENAVARALKSEPRVKRSSIMTESEIYLSGEKNQSMTMDETIAVKDFYSNGFTKNNDLGNKSYLHGPTRQKSKKYQL